MGTLRLFKTSRLGVLARLASFFRPAAGESEPAPVAAPDYDYDEFIDITDELLARLTEHRRRYPDPPTSFEEFRDRHKPVPPHIGKDFLKNRPAILDIRDGVAIFENGTKIDSKRLLNSRREKANSGE
ncbi:MAG: hypothetical protein MPJ82_00220 [Alphaproteobacteria bacterium]|nr:hypothetical protein [Alphaproteobacteria bacterium]MDA7989424.1 hypothetical protein [Alphaproteobacteria bacterium]MDA8032538.1 hypothetical protein [Alphaproteobacteria bacterium]